MFKKSKGFTLIELLIVMAVIAILIAIAIPSFRGMQDQARTAKAQGDLRVLKLAVEAYYTNHNSYPTSEATCQDVLIATSPKVIESKLYDPFGAASTTEYRYDVSPDGKYYIIWSLGPDRAVTITGIDNTPAITGTVGNDIYTTNSGL